MAEFLLASYPLAGHTMPLRPIARELVARGHRVRWYTSSRFTAAVQATGAHLVAMPPYPQEDGRPLDDVFPERAGLAGLAQLRWDMKNLFIGPGVGQRDGLRAIIADRPVDAVICDVGLYGPRFLGESGGPPWVTVGISPLVLPSRDLPPFGLGLTPKPHSVAGRLRDLSTKAIVRWTMRDVLRYLNRVRADLGLPQWTNEVAATFCSPYLHLQAGVPRLEYPRRDLPEHVRFVGALLDPDPNVTEPAWWSDVEQSERPIVHVTQGTVANGDLEELVRPTIRALSHEDVLVVATLGSDSATYAGPLPDNARVAPFLPYDKLLPRTSAMVTNGGFGGVQYALSHGVPLVLAGQGEDKPEVAARVAWAGAGLDLRTRRPSAERIRHSVRRLLDTPNYRAAARQLSQDFATLDAGVVSADLIEDLVRRRGAAPA